MSRRKYVEIANRYIDDVLSGAIPACKWVRLACQRQRDDLARGADFPYRFDEKKAVRICAFAEQMPHIKGEWANRKEKIKLEPFQAFILSTVFGWVEKDSGNRRFRIVYIEVPRKNAKSTISSVVGNYMLALDGEAGAEVYSAATSRDQAKIVFVDAQNMARRSPEFREKFGVEVNAHNINVITKASKFEALSAESSSLEGLNTHCGIIDELHAHKTRNVYDVIEQSMGARLQPLLWCITTAGSNQSGICYEVRSYLAKILEGVCQDETFFGVIWTIDDGLDWTTEEAWKMANPNYGISVKADDMRRLCQKAMQMPSAQNNFLTKRLNVWVNADSALFDMLAWNNRCADPKMKIEDFAGEPCILAVDLSSKTDLAAVLAMFERGGIHYYFPYCYLPEETIEESTNSQYSGWVRQGYITETPGNIIDYGYIEDDIAELKSQFEIKEIAYDPFQATQFATRMLAEGYPMVELTPSVKNFSEPTKQLGALISAGKVRHPANPVFTWSISNVVGHLDRKDNIYPTKERPENKIDPAICAIMAENRWISIEAKMMASRERIFTL